MCVRETQVHTKTFFNLTDILDRFGKDILRGVAQLAEDLVSYKKPWLQPLKNTNETWKYKLVILALGS